MRGARKRKFPESIGIKQPLRARHRRAAQDAADCEDIVAARAKCSC